MHEAHRLVRALLEGLVTLRPPSRWPNFTKAGGHGSTEFLRHVADEDMSAVLRVLRSLAVAREPVQVPDGRWIMRLPEGYGLMGTGAFGNSILGRREAMVTDATLIPHPGMTEAQEKAWQRVRRAI